MLIEYEERTRGPFYCEECSSFFFACVRFCVGGVASEVLCLDCADRLANALAAVASRSTERISLAARRRSDDGGADT